MLEKIKVLYHSCIKFDLQKKIYIDPFGINEKYNDADIILITHSHYDHFSPEDIQKVRTENSIIFAPKDLYVNILKLNFKKENIFMVEPNNVYNVLGYNIYTVPAYNIDKQFHPKENNWVGYIVNINNCSYYIAGDTDINEDIKKVKCDVAFLPVGGTYTMTAKEAAELANIIKPKIAIPIHYGSIVGNRNDANTFVKNLHNDIKGEILLA